MLTAVVILSLSDSIFVFFFFFFKQKTVYEMRIRDWSSDVCSSDLTIWTTHAWPASRSRAMLATSDGVCIAVIRWLKKRCLADSKALRAADLAWAFKVPVAPVMLAACIAASRLLWMI